MCFRTQRDLLLSPLGEGVGAVCGCPTLAAFLFLRLGWGWARAPSTAFGKLQARALCGGPCGLDLHGSLDSCRRMPEAGPRPIFRLRDQAAGHWILILDRARHLCERAASVCPTAGGYSSSSSMGRLALARIFSATSCGTKS